MTEASVEAANQGEPDDTRSELVAIDLGSNSFHMIIARLEGGQLRVIDRMRERVQLAAGLDADKFLTAMAMHRGLECLARFEQRLRPIPSARVRVVGTNTLRKARNARDFITDARRVLGHPIEIISGREEARLIYLGVAHDIADDRGRRLVVDIGGGSTECILGERFEARRVESLHMGCVGHTQNYFGDGKLTRSLFREAATAAQVELEPIKLDYQRMGWVTAVGASGTINAIDTILRTNGWSDDGITLAGLRTLRDAMIDAGRISKLSIPGLSTDRTPVIAGGLAILYGIFKSLQIERMTASGGALREGLLYDTIGRIRHEDIRDRTIEQLTERFRLDRGQGLRVEATASGLLDQVRYAWELHHPEYEQLLGWAARLHELGLCVSYSGFHMHGAYLVEHTDMPGFSHDQQAFLAALIAAHRRRLKPERLDALRALGGSNAIRLATLLRIAATLDRSRDAEPLPEVSLVAAGDTLELTLPPQWLQDHPMTRADLVNQAEYLSAAGLHFTAR